MIKKYLLIIFLIASSQLFSQEVYFLTGNNFTKYIFKTSEGNSSIPLQVGTGSTYDLGYAIPMFSQNFYYSIGFSLNDYNAVAGIPSESYKWDTKFIGIQNTVSYNYAISNDFQLSIKGGFNFSTLIYGKQHINGAVYDLTRQSEFSGLFLSPFVGLQTRYKLGDLGYLSLGYAFSKSMKPFNNSPEKLSFITNQILFGIHLNVNQY